MNRQKITSKVSRGILLSAVAVTAVLGASSCNKTEISVAKGDNIRFMVGLGGGENSTKTAYSDGNAADRSKAEDINWMSGDQIRIWSPECSEPMVGSYGAKDRCADYTVTPKSGSTTSGTIAVNPGTVGLRWGEPNVTHNFYAVYPSPNTTGKGDDSGIYGAASSFKFTGHIPAVQAINGSLTVTGPDSDDGKTTTVAAPDMNNLYMVAKSTAMPTDSDEGVFLDFVPLSTAIQFTIENAMMADTAKMRVKSVTLKSDPKSGTAKNLAGAFEVNMSGTWTKHDTNNNYPDCTEPAGGASQSTSLTIDFSQTPACTAGIAKGNRLQFTFFLLPTQSIDDLSFVITRKDGSGSNALKKRLEINGTSVTFPVHKKTYVKGLLVPDGVQWVSFDYEIADWSNSEGGEIEMQNPD